MADQIDNLIGSRSANDVVPPCSNDLYSESAQNVPAFCLHLQELACRMDFANTRSVAHSASERNQDGTGGTFRGDFYHVNNCRGPPTTCCKSMHGFKAGYRPVDAETQPSDPNGRLNSLPTPFQQGRSLAQNGGLPAAAIAETISVDLLRPSSVVH